MIRSYYVYALKDPRTTPAKYFYIGKGSGTRAYDHIARIDGTNKGKRIAEIENNGHKVIISKLVDSLTEIDALKLEAELISAFGTENTGGILMNTVIPSGEQTRPPPKYYYSIWYKRKGTVRLINGQRCCNGISTSK